MIVDGRNNVIPFSSLFTLGKRGLTMPRKPFGGPTQIQTRLAIGIASCRSQPVQTINIVPRSAWKDLYPCRYRDKNGVVHERDPKGRLAARTVHRKVTACRLPYFPCATNKSVEAKYVIILVRANATGKKWTEMEFLYNLYPYCVYMMLYHTYYILYKLNQIV